MFMISVFIFGGPLAFALSESGQSGDLAYSIYAPEWTWQKRDINLLIVLRNTGADESLPVESRLHLPKGDEGDFGIGGNAGDFPEDFLRRTVEIPPGGTLRIAYAGITALKSAPGDVYAFGLELNHAGVRIELPYPVRIIRGEIFSGGRWMALGVPAGVGLVWCVAFAWYLGRRAGFLAWLRIPHPIDEPREKDPWIEQTP
ncbi:MAG: hypothetical protein AMXMBFR84_45440 [Candidatus Hydrogenedentota bacterium]